MKKNLFTAALVSIFLLGGMEFTTEAKADPLDKSSPKIAHGMYKDRGKSSPKISEGMHREIDKSSPKIAHGMYRDRGKSSPKIAHGIRTPSDDSIRTDPNDNLIFMVEMALEIGDVELADELVDKVLKLDYGFRRR